MYKFGLASTTKLATCDIRLQQAMSVTIRHFDIGIIHGHRTDAEQQKIFDAGFSKLQAGESKHNASPSLAVDFAPYHPKIGYMFGSAKDVKKYAKHYGVTPTVAAAEIRELYTGIAMFIRGVLAALGHNSRWGGDWDGDGEIGDNKFDDLGHVELA